MDDQNNKNFSSSNTQNITNTQASEDPPSPDSAIGSPNLCSPDVANAQNLQSKLLANNSQQNMTPPRNNEREGQEKEEDDILSEEDSDIEAEEDSMSESEMVVTGSMQFALTPTGVAQISSCTENSDTGAVSDQTAVSGEGINLHCNIAAATRQTTDSSQTAAETEAGIADAATDSSQIAAETEAGIADAATDSSQTEAATVAGVPDQSSPAPQEVAETGSGVDNKEDSSGGTDVEDSPATPRVRVRKVKRKRRPGELGLPSTVVRLEGPGGCEVFIVGTAHFSTESQQDVVTTIERVRPDVLCLELCRARTAILSLDEATILEESKSMDMSKMVLVLRQHGRVQGVLYLLLLSVSAHITKELGMAPGGEFRAAVAAAKRVVPHCSVQLGDRPINVTLGRALAALSPWSKVKLAFHMITTSDPISKEDVEKCKDKDMIEELLAEMTGQFPAISEVFVTERDKFLANSLRIACTPQRPDGFRPRRVVGVVGIGHQKGIQEHWGKLRNEDIVKLLRIPPPSFANRAVGFMCRVGFYSTIGFVCYRFLLPTAAKTTMHESLQRAAKAALSVLPVTAASSSAAM